jgi:hypothetical protein
LEAQTRAMADYAAACGWVIVESHSDEGVSGSKDSTSRPANPAFRLKWNEHVFSVRRLNRSFGLVRPP